jgi:colanic acid/amylovoran biosynthesis glycosyltransferase
MRLLYLTARFPCGVSEAFLAPELRELSARGHRILVVPVRAKGMPGENDLDVQFDVAALWSPRVLRQAAAQFARLSDGARARLWLAITGGSLSTRLKNTAAVAKALYAGWLARAWGAEHIHAYWAATPATVAMIAAEIAGVPWSFTAHRWEFSERDALATKVRSARGVRLISESGRTLLRDALVREGSSQRDAAQLAAQAHVIHLGVETASQPSPRPATNTIMCPASLVAVKGHSYLLQAMRIVAHAEPSAVLLLAGDGPLRAKLQAEVHQLGIEHCVRFLGHVRRAELLATYSRGEVACVALASLVLGPGLHEGIPVSLMEAMSHGIPVVATATGGTPELLGDGAGLLVPERDPELLSSAMLSLLRDSTLWHTMARRGRERVLERFNAKRTVPAILDLMSGSEPAVV